jgi:hypothetical protein
LVGPGAEKTQPSLAVHDREYAGTVVTSSDCRKEPTAESRTPPHSDPRDDERRQNKKDEQDAKVGQKVHRAASRKRLQNDPRGPRAT